MKIDLISLEASRSGTRPVQQAAYRARFDLILCDLPIRRRQPGASAKRRRRAAGNALGCQDLRSRLFLFAQRSEDLAPLAARGGAYLTETEAAASIPVNAIAQVPEREASLTEMEAAASIPVSALAEVPERRPQQSSASNPFAFFFTRLRHIFD